MTTVMIFVLFVIGVILIVKGASCIIKSVDVEN